MIKVEQTKLGYPDGNCFSACLASILELSLDEVPCFTGEDWLSQYNLWLADNNLALVNCLYKDAEGNVLAPAGYSILAADSPRGNWKHAVVCFNGNIVHDPHPLREMGLGKRHEWTIFLILDPSKAINKEK
jgi:hypothetical protein